MDYCDCMRISLSICYENAFIVFMAEKPGAPLGVTVGVESVSSQGTILWVKWMRPHNFDQFDIDRYDISLTWRSRMQMEISTGESTMKTIRVNENGEGVPYTATVAARNLCGEIGDPGSSGKFSHLFCIDLKTN